MTADDLNAHIKLPDQCWFEPFKPDHLNLTPDALTTLDLENILQSTKCGYAFTLMVGDRIGAIFGLRLAWRGLAEGWMISTVAIKPIAAEFTYAMRKFCDLAARMLGLRRIQIHVEVDKKVDYQWARAARFCEEARCPSYLPDGESVYLMSRIYGSAT